MSKAEEIPALSFILEPLSECWLVEGFGMMGVLLEDEEEGKVEMS